MVMIDEAKAAEEVERMYEQREKEINQLKKQQRKQRRKEYMVMSIPVLGWMGLFFLAIYLVFSIPFPGGPFFILIRSAIYFFMIIPIFGWLLILINKYFEK
jgi:ABC-type multidrug transport system fused ATPase/permease subunit